MRIRRLRAVRVEVVRRRIGCGRGFGEGRERRVRDSRLGVRGRFSRLLEVVEGTMRIGLRREGCMMGAVRLVGESRSPSWARIRPGRGGVMSTMEEGAVEVGVACLEDRACRVDHEHIDEKEEHMRRTMLLIVG